MWCLCYRGIRSYSQQGTDSSSGMGLLGRSGVDTGTPLTPHPMVIPQESFGKQLGLQPRIAPQDKASQGMEVHDFVLQDGTWRDQCPQWHPSPMRRLLPQSQPDQLPVSTHPGNPVGPWHWHDPVGVMQILGMEPQASSFWSGSAPCHQGERSIQGGRELHAPGSQEPKGASRGGAGTRNKPWDTSWP